MFSNGIPTGSIEADRWGFYGSLLVQNKRDLEMSWQRCRDAGMDPGDRPEPAQITRDKLKSVYVEEGARIRGLALAEMRTLYKQLGRRGYTLTFANTGSVILDCIPGNDIVSGRRHGDDLAPGNCWCESARGTNAVGTAVSTRHAMVVLGNDHYLRAYHDLICIAKPVFTASGDMAAILDATVHGRNGQMDLSELAYVLGLMHMSADHIETELFKEQHQSSLVIQTKSTSESVASANASFAFDISGNLENMSRAAASTIEGLAVHVGCHFEQIFRLGFSSLRRRMESPVDFLEMEDCNGRHHYATLYFPYHNRDIANGSSPHGRYRHGDKEDKDTAVVARPRGADFICADPAVAEALETLVRATEFGVPVLIRGETGTGKELLARHIHRVSGRAGKLVSVNCAAVPESLIEAELFGYEQGAFTGARRGGSSGLVRQANGGTLFLDEIGDMPLELQGRVLRLLDTWRVRPVGSEREYDVDAHLVTATHCDLELAVTEGRFRLDLLHRIKVVEVRLPALRERTDFDEIARALLAQVKPSAQLTEGGIAQLRTLPWEGNMRQLRNALTRLLIRADGGIITQAIVEQEFGLKNGLGGMSQLDRKFGHVDNDALEATFRQCWGNVAATARELGISRTTVYNRLRRLKDANATRDS